jgi:hypothetical protein
MIRTITRTAIALTTAATLGAGLTTAPAAAAPTTVAPATVTLAAVAEPRLVDIDTEVRNRFERINLRFRGGTPDIEAQYVRRARLDNGRVVRLPGRAILLLTLEPARARAIERGLQDLDLDNVLAFRILRDRGGVVRIAVALRERVAIRILERNNRLIIDVANRDADEDEDA